MSLIKKLELQKYPVTEKTVKLDSNRYILYHLGIKSYKSDDEIYQKNRILQTHVPRALFGLYRYNTDTEGDKLEFMFYSHGTHKFGGMEDGQEDDVLLTPEFKDMKLADHVIFTEKSNGKMVTFRIFDDRCLLTSKSVGIIFELSDLNEDKKIGNNLIGEIYIAFKEMWLSFDDDIRKWIIDICKNHTFQLEYNDGKHMIPLDYGVDPHLEFTALIKIGDHPSESHIVSDIDGKHVYDYLRDLNINNRYLVKQKTVLWDEYYDYKDRSLYMNIIDKGKPTEGYVALICTKDNRVIAPVKIKNISYILLRMLREHLKKSPSLKSIKNLLVRRLTGPKAYPKIKNDEFRVNIEHLFCNFFLWLKQYSKKQNKPFSWLLNFQDDSPGMGFLWRSFCEEYSFSLEDCFTSCEHYQKICPKFIFEENTCIDEYEKFIRSGFKKGCYKVANRIIEIKIYPGSDPDKVVLIRGPQGVGKTTFAELTDRFIVSADDYDGLYVNGVFQPKLITKAHEYCREQFTKCLKEDKKLIVSNTNAELWEMSYYALSCLDIGMTVVQIEPEDDGDTLESIHLGTDFKQAQKIIKKKLEVIRDNPLPKDILDIAKKISPHTKNPITCVRYPLTPFLKWVDNDRVKTEFHTTLSFGRDKRDKYPETVKCIGSRIIEHVEEDSVIRCMEVELWGVDDKKIDSTPHITLFSSGRFKPVDSNKLLSGDIEITSIHDICLEVEGVVTLL